MLGLRTTAGVSLDTLRNCVPQSTLFISDLLPKLSAMESNGLITLTPDGKIKIPPGKFFISDGIIRDLFV
jgi:coproporphyrinogen III oxidase-like Fe-S oxidoreductase